LNGANPVRIVHKELRDSQHYRRTYYGKLLLAIQGPEDSFREQLLKVKDSETRLLNVEEQVECLIELARCPDVLGRTWIGWGAYI
jgi:hypothetical protein